MKISGTKYAIKVPFDGIWLYLTERDPEFQIRVRTFDSFEKATEFAQAWGVYKIVGYDE